MFISDQREIVLNAIRRIEPNFQPKYTPPFLTYTNPLLESLNENIRPIEEKLYKTVLRMTTKKKKILFIDYLILFFSFSVPLSTDMKLVMPKRVFHYWIWKDLPKNN